MKANLRSVIGSIVAAGIELSIDGSELGFVGRRNVVDDQMLALLRENKIELLAWLKDNKKRGVERISPTTREQRRMEWRTRSDRNGAAYNVVIRLDIEDQVSEYAIADAVKELTERYDEFRSRFVRYGDQLIRETMRRSAASPMQVLDRVALASATDDEISAWCKLRGSAPFDLAQEPPIRWCYSNVGERRAIVLLTIHHIICDGWSIGHLLDDLQTLLSGHSLPPMLRTARDFAYWELETLSGDAISDALEFWHAKLGGVELSPKFERCACEAAVGGDAARIGLALPDGTAMVVANAAKQAGVTEFSLYLAAFGILLSRETGCKSIAIVIAVANRESAANEDMMGLARNAQPIPCSVFEDDTLSSVARRVGLIVHDALTRQWLPIECLNGDIGSSDFRRLPLTFAFERAAVHEIKLPTQTIVARYVFTGAARGGLSLMVRHDADVTEALLEYAVDSFSDEDASQMLKQYREILQTLSGSRVECEAGSLIEVV